MCRQSTESRMSVWECATPLPPEILYQAGAKFPVGLNSTANVRLFAETAKCSGKNVMRSGDLGLQLIGQDCSRMLYSAQPGAHTADIDGSGRCTQEDNQKLL